ncbi:MAG: nitroreductase family protein [Dehalococcoidia bacterium]|nr:nitroreductase family protein [Dehalococcoidia bacterium]
MDAYEAIITKRDTREYEARPVAEEHLQRLLQAARMAGSSKNEQPIRLVVVRDPMQKQALAACGDFTAHLSSSPLVIVVVRVEGSRPFDAGRTAQNMMVAANALGIASCPVGIQHDEPAREVLGLPDDQIVAMAITLGYPKGGDRPQGRGERRMSLGDFVSYERWGQGAG